jgi:valyl-tRNA synthetase
VLLHPIIRDQDGNKMSKSRGNVIDPLNVIDGISLDDLLAKTRSYPLEADEIEHAVTYQTEHYPKGFPECGTDALRFTLAAYTGQDQDIRFSVDRVDGNRKFGNKIWQATLGFALPHLKDMAVSEGVPTPHTLADRWIMARLAEVAENVNAGLEAFRVGDVTHLLYHFFWDELCSWYIELLKPTLSGDDEAKKAAGKQVLRHVLDTSLRLLHPLMPFITEVLWHELPRPENGPASLMVARFPTAADGVRDDAARRDAERLMAFVSALRTLRAEYDIAPSVEISVVTYTDDAALTEIIETNAPLIGALAKTVNMTLSPMAKARIKGAATAVIDGAELLVPLKGIINTEAELGRLNKEKQKIEKQMVGAVKKLANEKFLTNAPEAVVAKERAKVAELEALGQKVAEAIARIEEVRGA